jgi:transposase
MAKAYSYDLRKRVIDLLDKGKKRKEIIGLLGISLNSVNRWIRLRKTRGDFQAIERKSGRKRKIVDLVKFEAFIQENNHLTLHAMAEKWGGVSYRCIGSTLKRMGYTFKKNHGYIKKEQNPCV